MNLSVPVAANSAPASGVTVARAATSRASATPLPSLASGFGSVMGQERDLQSSTGESLRLLNRHHAAALERLLHNQQAQLSANIALLARRSQMLPHPARFRALDRALTPLTTSRRAARQPADPGLLPNLIAQHLTVLKNLEALIGQRSDLILTTMARNHDDMAWALTAVVEAAAPNPGAAVGRWENEGGSSEPCLASHALGVQSEA